MTDIHVLIDPEKSPQAKARYDGHVFDVTIGRNGAIPEAEKTEGDFKTPLGRYRLKRVFYRADKIAPPQTALPLTPITPAMGWCDDPDDAQYNRLIEKPYAASHEDMYRDDDAYDLVVEISHNDHPPLRGKGSAIFLHLKHPDGRATAGCIGFDHRNLRYIVDTIKQDCHIEIGLAT